MIMRRRARGAAWLTTLVLAITATGFSFPAQADDAMIFGYVTDASTGNPAKTMTVRLFRSDANDKNWTYLRKVNVSKSGIYQIATAGPGRYHLQLVDRRPAYNVRSYARVPNVNVSVGSSSVVKDVRVRIGGAVGGKVKVTIRGKSKRAGYAHIRAVSDEGQIHEVRADRNGGYALGGLARGNYRVFAYDSHKRRVGPSRYVRNIKLRTFRTTSFNLRSKPSTYRGFLTVGGALAKGSVTVTAVNRRTGEYWVQKISGGALSLRGLTAGGYTLTVPDTNGYFGQTVKLPAVKAGRTRSAHLNLQTRAGTITGTVVDATSGNPLPNVSIRLTDGHRDVQSEITASSTGRFSLGGTLRAQGNLTVEVFAYDKIGEHRYVKRTFEGLAIMDNETFDLNALADGDFIKLQRQPVPAPTPTPSPSTSTPTPSPSTSPPTPPVVVVVS